jgi:hypothetical protein
MHGSSVHVLLQLVDREAELDPSCQVAERLNDLNSAFGVIASALLEVRSTVSCYCTAAADSNQ